jgi:hypothetical protein
MYVHCKQEQKKVDTTGNYTRIRFIFKIGHNINVTYQETSHEYV